MSTEGRGVRIALEVAGSTVGLVVLPWLAAVGYSRRYLRRPDDLPSVEVALVPGAYVRENGEPGVHLTARLELALAAFRAGRVRAILISGGHPAGAQDEPAAMRRWLLAHDVPHSKIISDPHGNTTYASVRRAQTVYGVESMIICSQNYHLPRAVVLARGLGLNAYGLGESRIWREHPRTSRRGLVREVGASYKMLRDVLVRPAVTLDRP